MNKLESNEHLLQLSRLLSKKLIPIHTADEIIMVNTNDIIYCSSEINYTHIWLINKHKLVVSKTLGDIEKLIANQLFYRIHQSYLINILWMKQYKKAKGGSVIMIDDTKLEVASRKREAFVKHLMAINKFS
jgi:two-component system, LytTR family, response regulator